ncbi:pyrimidine 5'-nucleotidase-domain-containing protein [Jimgerdemannia flammicorona]|uniref:5'-nucleotidase n=1 Tax=Jimgerdemannia flammicorona TaxID=994334 RepID=A0A433DAB0_9FUNG|nr:pyrimidine 5'-nucleotidase-domain-containing protein [Jimgerdemannia flammicorona]
MATIYEDDSRARQLIADMLQDPTVRIRSPKEVEVKLAKIVADGPDNMHFICDFDMTISRHWVTESNGQKVRNMSSHGVLANYCRLNTEVGTNAPIPNTTPTPKRDRISEPETQRLYDKYYPIEISHQMTYEEKIPHMVAWWDGAHAALITQRITHEDIAEMVRETPLELRELLSELLVLCRDKNVPFLVFSAGIRDIIEEILSSRSLFHPNMHVVANKMGFNPTTGFCDHFEDPLIHVFNKSEFQLESTPRYYSMIEHRRNVILVGDSKGDLQMSKGVRHDLCLNIGFLNHDVEALVEQYKEVFDVVLVGDQTFSWVNRVLEEVR